MWRAHIMRLEYNIPTNNKFFGSFLKNILYFYQYWKFRTSVEHTWGVCTQLLPSVIVFLRRSWEVWSAPSGRITVCTWLKVMWRQRYLYPKEWIKAKYFWRWRVTLYTAITFNTALRLEFVSKVSETGSVSVLICIRVQVVHWSTLAPPNGSNWIRTFPSLPWRRKRFQFPNSCVWKEMLLTK
jgi:hypothetical protein